MMTMSSSTPVWDESLVFAESYRRLLAPESLVLFELVDFAAALSSKEARQVGGLYLPMTYPHCCACPVVL